MKAVEALALVGGHVDKELLLRNEYLAAENEILKLRVPNPLRLSDAERVRLAKIAERVGRRALKDIACIVKPDTLFDWFRKLVANKFDGSGNRQQPGRPAVDPEIEAYILRFAEENPTWGYDRIAGALSNIGFDVCDQTIGNILKKNGISPAPNREPHVSWDDFIKMHEHVLAACDFFTTEIITRAGLMTCYVLFFIHVGTREIHIPGVTFHPHEVWMKQVARNLTMAELGFLSNCRYLIHDRDAKFCASFREILKSAGIKPIRLPPNSPNLNAYSERWVRSIKNECLSKLIFFGEESLRLALKEYTEHYHFERNHQGMENRLLFPDRHKGPPTKNGPVLCNSRLNGLLKFYYREPVESAQCERFKNQDADSIDFLDVR